MNDPHWLVQELAGAATWQAIVTLALGAGWALKNRQKIADKLGLNKRPIHLAGEIRGKGTLSGTLRVVSERSALWNTHALVGSERQALWNVEARNRFIDRTLEIASWILPDLVRHILR